MGIVRRRMEEPKRVTGKDTSNCTSAVGTGCKTCKDGFELEKWVEGKFTKCVKKPSIMPVKRVEEPKKQEFDWANFDFDGKGGSSSSSNESSSSESSSSESSSSSDFSSGWDNADWGGW